MVLKKVWCEDTFVHVADEASFLVSYAVFASALFRICIILSRQTLIAFSVNLVRFSARVFSATAETPTGWVMTATTRMHAVTFVNKLLITGDSVFTQRY